MDTLEPVLVVNLFPLERQHLLWLLADLQDEEWNRPTICASWTVKDIALHVLGDDIGFLSRRRDNFNSSTLPGALSPSATWNELVAYLDHLNAVWVEAARRMSNHLACTLLARTGEELYQYLSSLDPYLLGEPVSWAGPDAAPTWLDIAREYTERWVHQQHIRDAVGRPGLKDRQFFTPVLVTFVRALPQTFKEVYAPAGTQIDLLITGEAGGEWRIRRDRESWLLEKASASTADARVILDQELAWRLFTKGLHKDDVSGSAVLEGNEQLARKVLDTVSIIA